MPLELPTDNIEIVHHANWLNENCPCTSLDRQLLPNIKAASALFSETPVFISQTELDQMKQQISALETVISNPNYQSKVLQQSPAIASIEAKSKGVFMGYDFHMSDAGPKLIEINTNAGGANFVDALYRAQNACCIGDHPLDNTNFDHTVIEMFHKEWMQSGLEGQLKTIVIVDEAPKEQFLFPEFEMLQSSLKTHGLTAHIAAPEELEFINGKLMFGQLEIDLVYNRSVDFYFEKPDHSALKSAFEHKAAVITPNPRDHALFAAKSNLEKLSNPVFLQELRIDTITINALKILPKTIRMTTENADELWSKRKKLFFKPVAGNGGKAVYRGDKITKKTWANILANDYVAQELVAPKVRNAKNENGDGSSLLKSDIRLYTYDGEVLIAAARLYMGQTTNFRTAGGGFAPIYIA